MKTKRATIVTDLGFGDAGKGSIVDFLARRGGVSAVVRYNGGAQAAHNVVTPDDRHHTFRQFGSGMFVPGVHTHLSRFMLVDPFELAQEAMTLEALHVRAPLERLTIDGDALVVTPFHKSANVIRETLRKGHAHGTCGMGIGETMAHSIAFPEDVIRVRDLTCPGTLERKFARIQEHFWSELREAVNAIGGREMAYFANGLADTRYPALFAEEVATFANVLTIASHETLRAYALKGDLLFEGAQGVLLDEWYGFHPHTTWSTTTPQNALKILEEIGYTGDIEKLGVLRAYFTRHGAGPFVTFDEGLTRLLPELHNGEDGWQGAWRSGWFDLVMARYALLVSGGVDSLAITNLDRFFTLPERKMCMSYRFKEKVLTQDDRNFLDDVHHTERGICARSLRSKSTLTDLVSQELLTLLLEKAEPLCVTMTGGVEGYVSAIEALLGVPVTLTSHGASANQKRVRESVLAHAA